MKVKAIGSRAAALGTVAALLLLVSACGSGSEPQPEALQPAPSIEISILDREQPVEFPGSYAGRPLLLSFFSPG